MLHEQLAAEGQGVLNEAAAAAAFYIRT